jgi:uncharacterized protein YpmB
MNSTGDFNANVAFLLVVIGSVAGIWWRIEGAIAKAKLEALTQAQAAAALATLAQTQLAEHKLHVAENYITKTGLRETTEQVIAAIHAVKMDVHGLNERIDRIFEQQHPQHQPTSPPKPRRTA